MSSNDINLDIKLTGDCHGESELDNQKQADSFASKNLHKTSRLYKKKLPAKLIKVVQKIR